ncbi:MAG: helix-turn-helix transcriptional regulator [Pseudomonadota bacterium]
MLTQDHLLRLCKARDQLRSVDQPSLDEVAKSAAMSRYHFIRQFKAVFGETPVQFRTRVRLERAKQLLAHSSDSITAICMAVGFSSLGSFSALFSRRFGRSPSAFRREMGRAGGLPTPGCLQILRAAWEHDSQI